MFRIVPGEAMLSGDLLVSVYEYRNFCVSMHLNVVRKFRIIISEYLIIVMDPVKKNSG